MIWRVSSSGRSCGRPRQRRSAEVFAAVMPLHDACHSIDSSYIGLILETVKFPNYGERPRSRTMTVHSTTFRPEQPIPAAGAAEALLPAARVEAPAAVPVAAKKFNLRKMLM